MKNTTAAPALVAPAYVLGEALNLRSAAKEVREFCAATFPLPGEAPRKTGTAGAAISTPWQEFCDNINLPLPMYVQRFLNTPARIAAFADYRSACRRPLTKKEAFAIANGRDIKGSPSKAKKPASGTKSRAKKNPCMGVREGEPLQVDVHVTEAIGVRETEKTLGMTYRRRYAQFARRAQETANEWGCPVRLLLVMFCAERNLRDAATAEKFGMPLSAVGLPSLWNGQIIITNRTEKYFDGQVGDPGAFFPEV
jgi:hypothetical protein